MPNSTQRYHTKHRLTCVTHMLGNHNQNQDPSSPSMEAMMANHHNTSTNLKSNQCTSNMVQTINAPLDLVWSIIKRFEYPQGYKQFIKGCTMLRGDGGIGSVREVLIMSGLPAEVSVERLDKLDNDHHVLKFSIIGGDHRLRNYSSTTTLHEEEERFGGKTVVIESYVVDIPAGSSGEDTRSFTDTIIGCNLRSLAKITEGININQKHT